MNNGELIKHIELSDIPEAYQPIVSLVGLDAFLQLCNYARGDELYFPMRETILRKVRNRLIMQEYDGYNFTELSKKYSLTVKHIKNIIKGSNSV